MTPPQSLVDQILDRGGVVVLLLLIIWSLTFLLATEGPREGVTPPTMDAARVVDVEGTMEDFAAAQEEVGAGDLYLRDLSAVTAATDKPPAPLPDKKHGIVARPTPKMQSYAKARQILRDTKDPEIRALIEILGMDFGGRDG